MRKSKRIYYNLEDSDITYDFKGYTFTFSSDLYRDKFVDRVENYVKVENEKLNARYNLVGDFRGYLAVVYYKKIEKRGFLVKYNGKLINESSLL